MTYKEAAEAIYTILELWDSLSENPQDMSCMSDHCHIEYVEALGVALILSAIGTDDEDREII